MSQAAMLEAPRTIPQTRGRVLVVEDETDLADMLRFNLEREGYQCATVASGDTALDAIKEDHPDLVILDRMLPGLSGDEVAARIKRDPAYAHIPILLLTAKAEEADQLVGFALGADDYVTKPFSMKVLIARVGAILRRAEHAERDGDVLLAGPIRLVVSRHEVFVGSRNVSLTATEFRILRALMNARGRVLSRSQLLDGVFGMGVVVTDRTIDVHITALRKKLASASCWIQTIRGVGYSVRQPAQHG